MHVLIKALISVGIILVATAVARRLPSTAGLIGVMPLTGALILTWVYLENRGDSEIMQEFARGAFWGMVPTILFFLAAFICFKKQLSLPMVLAVSFGIWLAGAVVHQWFLK